METDTVITLDNGKDYQILLENALVNGNYLLAVELDDEDEFTKNFKVFEKKYIDGEEFVDEIENQDILSQLMVDFQLQYKDMIEDLADEEGIDLNQIKQKVE